MSVIRLHDRDFRKFVSHEEIQQHIAAMAAEMKHDLADKHPLFISVLNGSFMFTADLLKHFDFDCEVTFVRLASYEGTFSSGEVKTIYGLDRKVKGRTVVILEDIVDTGLTVYSLIGQLHDLGPAEVRVATLFFKPECLRETFDLGYIGMKIPDKFVVGYGLDYDRLGRNLKDLYVLNEE